LDTNAPTSGKSWALKAALVLMAAGAAAVLYVVFAASSKPETASGLRQFARGEMAQLEFVEAPPAFPVRPVQNAAGETSLLADQYDGDVIVLNLWATWCPPCIEEMPTLAGMQRRFEGRNVDVVVVSFDAESARENAQAMLARLGGGALDFWIDPSRGMMFDLGARGMPLTVIYDRQRREVARLTGGADWAGDDAAALVEAVLESQ